jgi:hypothetical protein
VLGDMKAHGNGRRISLLELKIDVAHPAVKCELRAVAERPALLRTIVRKMDHIVAAFLKPGGILSQHKHRPFRAKPDQPDPLPYEDCFSQAIASFGNEDHSAARRRRRRLRRRARQTDLWSDRRPESLPVEPDNTNWHEEEQPKSRPRAQAQWGKIV